MTKSEDPATVRAGWHETVGSDLPLDLDSVFQETDGYFARRANERRAKLLRELSSLLVTALEPSEAIRFASRGYLYSTMEFLLSGHVAAMQTNQVALILTDRRLLWLQVDSKGRPKDLKNQVRLERIRRVSGSWTGQWTLETVSREKLGFNSIPRADRKALVALIPGSPNAQREAAKSVEHLCPVCIRVVLGPVGSIEKCPNPACRIPFRSPKKAAWLSALVPGVGDLYLRHFAFGALEFVGSIAVLCVALFAVATALVRRDSESFVMAAILGGFLVALPRILDFALTLHMGRKGIVPLTTTPAQASIEDGAPIGPSRVRPLPAFPAWSWALFVLGAVAVVATSWYSYTDARLRNRIVEACRLAEIGRIAEATNIYGEVEARGRVDTSDRGRFALALWEGGDFDGGDRLVEGLGTIDNPVADRLNAFLARQEEAVRDLGEGRKDLFEGSNEAAWVKVDRAISVFSTLETAPLPKSRHDVVIELAGELLGPPIVPEDLAVAERLTELAGTLPGADGRIEIARLRIRASGAGTVDAKAAVARIDPARLDVLWRLLALEARAAFAEGDAEAAAIAREAEAVSLDQFRLLADSYRAYSRARRGALMIFGGRTGQVPAADLEAATKLAGGQG